jgi:DNA-binding transcriptional LysR family regulator
MLDWNDLRYFLAIHRAGTLARAATLLGVNATTAGRRLTALEEEVKARLFDRTPDGYVLTPSGRDLLPRAERMEEEAIALERDVLGADQKPAGVVRVTATEMLATRFIVPQLPSFRAKYPDLTVALECTNRAVSLSRREADIALRLARPREENVVTRRLASIPLALYAAPSYLERQGTPPDPETSLAGHEAILFADSRAFAVENEWYAARLEGARVALRSDSVSSIYSATLAGLGIALLPVAVAGRDPALRRLETRTSPEPRVIWQAVHADIQKSARIRAVLDFFTDILSFERP